MNRAVKFWDNAAKNYEKAETRFDKIHKQSIEMTKKHLKSSDNILDFGCGPGTKAFHFAEDVKSVQGIDISTKMIEMANKHASEKKITNVSFEQTSLFDEKFEKESFDVITAFSVLHVLDDLPQTVERVIELLKPGGLFISITPCLKEKMAPWNRFELNIYLLLMKLGLLPMMLTNYKFAELIDIIEKSNFNILETEKVFYKMSSYFIVAKKK